MELMKTGDLEIRIGETRRKNSEARKKRKPFRVRAKKGESRKYY